MTSARNSNYALPHKIYSVRKRPIPSIRLGFFYSDRNKIKNPSFRRRTIKGERRAAMRAPVKKIRHILNFTIATRMQCTPVRAIVRESVSRDWCRYETLYLCPIRYWRFWRFVFVVLDFEYVGFFFVFRRRVSFLCRNMFIVEKLST